MKRNKESKARARLFAEMHLDKMEQYQVDLACADFKVSYSYLYWYVWRASRSRYWVSLYIRYIFPAQDLIRGYFSKIETALLAV